MGKQAKPKVAGTKGVSGRGDKPRKKNPGPSPKQNNGKTVGGYSAARARQRKTDRMRQFLEGGSGELHR
jgi:hypothetical protein